MASKELSILLTAKDLASKTIGKVSKEVSTLGKVGARARAGVAALGRNLAIVGTAAAVGIGAAVKAGIESLATLESATTSVTGAIEQMGLAGQVTAGQVATWANEIETDIGAAFDDKDITAAAATLIRYGKLAPKNIRPAMVVMTDLAAKTGDVESASTLLAKALADPTKAAGKLARQGIILSKAQQDQIKAMVEAGDVAGAQALILDNLARSTSGAARASQGPYQRAMSVLADVTEDAQRALAEGFLPVLEELASFLTKSLADPKVMQGIRDFGKTLAGGLRSLIEIAKNLPWGTIGDSLKIAGAGAKAVLEAFTKLPPWVQTAVLTGWGLNKLTGGALTGIVGELGKGVIKGVLGMNAGVGNLRAGTVVGGPGGGVVPGGGATGRLGSFVNGAMKVFMVGAAAGVAVALAGELGKQSTEIREQGKTLVETTKVGAPQMSERELVNAINSIDDQMRNPLNSFAAIITNPLNGGLDALRDTRRELVAQLDRTRAANERAAAASSARLSAMAAAMSTLAAKDFSPKVNVNTGFTIYSTVSVRGVNVAQNVRASYNRGTSTAGGQARPS